MCAIYSCHASRRDTEETFRPSAPFRRRIAEMGLDVTFRFQTVKRGIDRADGHFPPYPGFYLLPNRDPIGAIRKSKKRQDDNVFKFTEIIAIRH